MHTRAQLQTHVGKLRSVYPQPFEVQLTRRREVQYAE